MQKPTVKWKSYTGIGLILAGGVYWNQIEYNHVVLGILIIGFSLWLSDIIRFFRSVKMKEQ